MVKRLGYGEQWIPVTPYLRARMRPSGLEVQGMQPTPEGGEGEPVEGCGWIMTEEAVVELAIMASAHRDAPEETKELLRDQLVRFLRGGFLETEPR
jgi:hypothetical protein